jgi:L-fuculose-phosphate aldolase
MTLPVDSIALRQSLVDGCRWMNASGFNHGTSGNLSVRIDTGLLVTPSGVPYDDLAAEDIVSMDMEGRYEHRLSASSEWAIHRDIYLNKPEAMAVVHAHPTYCTALAIQGRAIPAVHYMIAFSGGPVIPCCRYETYGTPELSAAVIEALANRNVCLMKHHGMIAFGPDLRRALWWASEVENLAQQYHLALQLGEPPLLTDDEVAKVALKFKSYGMRPKAEETKA